jgi:sugar phosphate isomerase/epimerase
MQLGVFTVLFQQLPLEQALDVIREAGVQAVEIGTGGYPGSAHCQPDVLLGDADKLATFQRAITSRGLTLSALSCHANPLHPQAAVAQAAHTSFDQTVRLAERVGVTRVVLFSGCPGDSDQARYPNWVTAGLPGAPGLAVERKGHPVLAQGGSVCT